ncbi:MAG: hypothetical protein LBD48_01215 [Treponema sp.]|jgi:hypothetical protein|nr:hypothetical protein [Treponema sp.]
MSRTERSHVFWGAASPLAGLAGGGLLIMASDRLAHAIVTGGALLWVYCFSALAAIPAAKIFPRQGKRFILIFLASFTGSVYLLLLWFLSPLAALEMFFVIPAIPLFCAASGIFRRMEGLDAAEALYRAASEALIMALLIIILALVREPLGFFCLSLPGGMRGIVHIFSFEGEGESFFPLRLAASSAGALLLLGYGAGLYRHFRKTYAPREED